MQLMLILQEFMYLLRFRTAIINALYAIYCHFKAFWQMQYKWRQLCRNSLVIIYTFENENVAKMPGTPMFALAVTVSKKKSNFLIFTLKK